MASGQCYVNKKSQTCSLLTYLARSEPQVVHGSGTKFLQADRPGSSSSHRSSLSFSRCFFLPCSFFQRVYSRWLVSGVCIVAYATDVHTISIGGFRPVLLHSSTSLTRSNHLILRIFLKQPLSNLLTRVSKRGSAVNRSSDERLNL